MASSLEHVSAKRALLIGNNNYKQGNKLPYCINNVNDLQGKLESIDFHVTVGSDLICDDMEKMFEDFIKEINPDDLILFFYSGYGIHSNDENYFVPIDDQRLTTPQMFEHLAINVQTIIDMIINRRPSSSIFIFDSSRPYLIPIETTTRDFINYGSFSNIPSLPNTLIICSSEKSEVNLDKSINGRNSLFIYYLLQYIDQPNLPIDELMDILSDQMNSETNHQQSPLIISSIRKNLYFNYQFQSEISERRASLIAEMICQSQSENRSLIDLRYKQLIDRDMKIVIKEVLYNKQCTRLWLDGNRLTSIGASILSSALNNNNTLQRLYLYGNSISDIGVRYLSKTLSTSNQTLQILGLQQNKITDLGAEHLANMLKLNKTLTALWLDNNDISDKGLKLLFNALQCSNSSLQYISLSKNALITDVSLNYIENLIQFNQTITEISLYDCNFSRTTKEKLKKCSKSKKKFSIYLNSWNE